jgi:tetratricopeptide (TPR) repeat protein
MTRVFLSYSTADRDLANQLKGRLDHRLTFWRDQERIDLGDALTPAIERAITEHDAVLLLLTPRSITSTWVQWEVTFARSIGRKIIPVFHEFEPKDLPPPFDKDQAAVALLPLETTRIRVLKALGLDPLGEPHELVLAFSDPALVDRPEGEAQITRVEATIHWLSHTGPFRSPLGMLEADDARWYLERYYLWPADEFENRARRIEAELPRWGRLLWDAVLTALGPDAAKAFAAWLATSEHGRRSLSIQVEAPDPDRDPPSRSRGTAALLALPWELLRDREGWFFHHHRVSLRRLMPSGRPVLPSEAPIRVLAVVARPAKAGIIDPRVSATGLLEAVEPLGSAVEVDFLRPPTLPALVKALSENRYHVMHFDGHGVYESDTGLGHLCFESPHPQRREAGEMDLVPGDRLREALGDRPLPLVFLEARQSADEGAYEGKVAGSAVATALLAAGAGALIAMSHSVLVETARRFTTELYRHLCEGQTVGQAVSAARTALFLDHDRGKVTNGLPLHLHDWFVPVLLQRGEDQPLLSGGVHLHPLTERTKQERAFATHSLPPALPHQFVGRLPERLALERLCEVPFSPNHRAAHPQRIGLIIGVGGQGKTTLAVELGRWLHRTGLFPGGVAFVSLEGIMGMTAVLSALGRAVMNGFVVKGDGEAEHAEAREMLKTHLRQRRTLLILDNFESMLPPPPDAPQAEQWLHEPELLTALLDLAHDLAQVGESRVLITSREGIDDPRFCAGPENRVVTLGGLSRWEAIELVGEICRREGIRPEAATEEDLGALVDAVSGHPRSLVLLPPLLKEQGVAGVTERLHELMAELEAKYPGQREKSLFASLKLSLDRLPKWVREKLPPLGLLRVGASLTLLKHALPLEDRDLRPFVASLTGRALATLQDGNYLRFHPALSALIRAESAIQDAEAWPRTVEGAIELIDTLYKLQFGAEPARAVALATAELPNLLQVLDHLAQTDDAASLVRAVESVTSLEGLLHRTHHRRALVHLSTLRQELASRLEATAWSKARFQVLWAQADRLLEAGQLVEALAEAEKLVENADRAGPSAYPHADYDQALAHFTRGRIWRWMSRSEEALEELEGARQRLALMHQAQAVRRMAALCLGDEGDCLQALGRLDEAAERYRQAIDEHSRLGDERSLAATRGQLATVRLAQGRLDEALDEWQSVRLAFEALAEPAALAVAWHQIGHIHQQADRLVDAERAYQASLAHHQARNDRFGAANTMSQLAIVTDRMGHLEESVAWDRRALALRMSLKDRHHEAISRNNLAHSLRRLGHLAEAEEEVLQAIKIREGLGLSAEPWRSWGILCHIKRDLGEATAAQEARESALAWYRRWRTQGGHPQARGTSLVEATARALSANETTRAEVVEELVQLAKISGLPTGLPALLGALITLLNGDPREAQETLPHLEYDDAVELERLLANTWP